MFHILFSCRGILQAHINITQAIWFKEVKQILSVTGKWYKNTSSLSVLSEIKSLIQTKYYRLPEKYLKYFMLQIKQAVSFYVIEQLIGNSRWWKFCVFAMDRQLSPWPCVPILFTATALFILTLWIVHEIHRTPGIRLYPSVSPQELTTIWHKKMFCAFRSICNDLF